MLGRLLKDGLEDAHLSRFARIRQRPFHYIIVLLCIVNISLILVNIGLWVIAALQGLFVRADFTAFYTGFYMVRIGEGARLYDVSLQSAYQQLFMGGLSFEGGVLRFPNPPFVAIIFSPLSFLRLDAAYYLWTLMQLALLVWLMVTMNRLFAHWDQRERLILLVTFLAFWPLTYNFLLGQFSLLLLAGLTHIYLNMKGSKLTPAGLWFALLAIKPHTMLIPGMMTLNRRYWRVALSAALTGIALFVFSSLVIGFKPWADYIQSLKALGSYFGEFGVNPNSEYTLRGLLSNLFGYAQGNLTNLFSAIFLVAGMILVWILWTRGGPQKNGRLSLYFAFTIVLSVFLSMHLNPHDSLMLVLPAALFYDFLRTNGHPRSVYGVIILLSPLLFILDSFTKISLFGVVHMPVALIFTMLIWTTVYLLRDHPFRRVPAASE